MLLEWRNDATTREMSLNTEAVSEEDHRRWLRASLANPDRRLFVCEVDGEPVGTTRLDRREGGWEISITTAPRHRGAGHGRTMLALTAAWFEENLKEGLILATIKPTNQASLALFTRNGYTIVSQDGEQVHLERR